MLRFRLSDAAQVDVIDILAWTHDQFDEAARLRYERLIVAAFRDVATQPGRPGSIARPVLHELLQGFAGPRAPKDIFERFAALPLLAPDRQDHVDAAELRNRCRRSGIQVGTIDTLLAQLCIRHELALLTTDNDFVRAAAHCPLKVWK